MPGPIGLDELLALARERNPDLAAAYARVAEAQGQFIQAGLYANPTATYVGDRINDGPGSAGEQGAAVSQEIVTGGKLRVAREAARYGWTAADWQAVSRWYDTIIHVRSAYYEYQTARVVLAESERIVAQFEEGLRKAEALARAGTVLNYEVLRFRVELAQAANRVGSARERWTAAGRLLAAAVGVSVLPSAVLESEPSTTIPSLEFENAAALGERSSFVHEAEALADQAREQLRLAGLQNVPNLRLQAGVMYDFTVHAPEASAQAGVMLPLWNRNQGNILAAQGRLAEAAAKVDQARLRVRDRLTAAFQKYQNARRQLELYEKQILPDARKALEQVQQIYEAKGERFFETLDARRVVAQARIDYLQALGDVWSAVSEIDGILQKSN